MTWANFDDNFASHPKVVALSDGAFRLHTSGILYSAKYLTDGMVPKATVALLTPHYEYKHLRELVDASLWAYKGNAYHIHDYLQWNRSREQIMSERTRKSEAGKRGAKRRWDK